MIATSVGGQMIPATSMPGILVQSPPNVAFMSAFPPEQQFQGQMAGIEFQQGARKQRVAAVRPPQQLYIPPNQRPHNT